MMNWTHAKAPKKPSHGAGDLSRGKEFRAPLQVIRRAANFAVERLEARRLLSASFAPTVYPVGGDNVDVITGDFNNDKKTDIVVSDIFGPLRVFLNDGTGGFSRTPWTSTNSGSLSNFVAAGDFNKDGALDLLQTNAADSTLSVFKGHNDGTFTSLGKVSVAYGAQGIALGDFNHDGNLDAALCGNDANGKGWVSVMLGSGTFNGGTLGFTPPTTAYATGANPRGLTAGNFSSNADGNLALVADNSTDGTVSVFLGNADGTFKPATTYSAGLQPYPPAVADLNFDGELDLIVPNRGTATFQTFVGTGNGTFYNAVSHVTPASPTNNVRANYAAAPADYNGDGIPDLALANVDNGAAYVYQGDGRFGFTLSNTFNPDANSTYSVASADFNGDGKPDFATVSEMGNLGVFLNTTPNTPPVADAGPPVTCPASPGSVMFNASNSHDAEGRIVSYQWNFSDGTPVQTTTSPYISHSYAAIGSYTATLTVTDGFGATGTATTTATAVDPFIVTNVNNSGAGSLSQAIIDANLADTNATPTITFNIPGPGVHTISSSNLPGVEHNTVLIDGYSQPGASPNTAAPFQPDNASILIEIRDHHTISGSAAGFEVRGSGVTVRGLAIGGCDVGIRLWGQYDTVTGNFIGTDATGLVAVPNRGDGVRIERSHATIGGTLAAARNILSGNSGSGIDADPPSGYTSAEGDVIQGNYIGTDASGTKALPNQNQGIILYTDKGTIGGTAAGAGNVISGNYSSGIVLYTGATVQGNRIGTNAAGNAPIANGSDGIYISNSAAVTVGGTVAEARNIISGNSGDGVSIYLAVSGDVIEGNYIGADLAGATALANGGNGISISSSGRADVTGNVISGNKGDGVYLESPLAVQGNFIGTNADGTALLGGGGNGKYGIELKSSANTVGGPTAGTGNIIAGNVAGGIAIDAGATTNLIQGNYIGTDPKADDLGNLGIGVSVYAPYNTIGAASDASVGGNCIAFNHGAGVAIIGPTSIGNLVSRNSIYSNLGLGIDLGNDGVTPNGSSPPGPNNWQGYPVLTVAKTVGGITTVNGTLSSPTGTYTVEFFSSPTSDPSGYGQGQTYLGSRSVTIVNGSATFSFTPATPVPAGQYITATARAPSAYTYTPLNDPSATRGTYAFGVSGNTIVGYYSDASGDHGFVYDGTSYTPLNVPSATRGTYASGVSGNTIVGYFGDASGSHGFVYDGTSYTTLNDPSATGGTVAEGVSGNTIVGYFNDASGSHGFVYDGATYTTLNVPSATGGTVALGVSGNTIVGYYSDASGSHGFVTTAGLNTSEFSQAAQVKPPSPLLTGTQVNDGSAQRSKVTGLTPTFDHPVTLQQGAVTIALHASVNGGGPQGTVPTLIFSTTDNLTYVVNFSGAGVAGGSIADGAYDLTVHADLVRDGYGQGLGTPDQVFSFFRLFGDNDGNGTVNLSDYRAFRSTFLQRSGDPSFNAAFDFDGNGTINLNDYRAFTGNFLKQITP